MGHKNTAVGAHGDISRADAHQTAGIISHRPEGAIERAVGVEGLDAAPSARHAEGPGAAGVQAIARGAEIDRDYAAVGANVNAARCVKLARLRSTIAESKVQRAVGVEYRDVVRGAGFRQEACRICAVCLQFY